MRPRVVTVLVVTPAVLVVTPLWTSAVWVSVGSLWLLCPSLLTRPSAPMLVRSRPSVVTPFVTPVV